ncbi:hypothetical protein BSPWISOXPB_3788 [uncultured Gammaproteobacteria bacterium]|nr:hypothetical protein BSPWISOXPB_3788 [uncultured Gammaproteobacteria bacterium]
MIIYSPIDGDTINYLIKFRPKHCFLITQLGKTKPKLVSDIEQSIKDCCQSFEYKVIDASRKELVEIFY